MIIEEAKPTLASLKSSHLPVLPAGVLGLISALSDENTPFNELASIIERFPGITARLIILANSAWSAPSSPVDNLMTACSRLGFNVIRNVSIALAVASPFSVHNCPGFNISKYWRRSLLTADIAAQVAEMMGKEHLKETARTAGLLHNLGLLWLADQLPDSIEEAFIQHEVKRKESLLEICNQLLGFNYAEAGAYLGLEWGLPEILVDAISHHYTLEHKFNTQITAIVALAVAVAQITEKSKSGEDSDDNLIIPDSMVPIQEGIVEFAGEMFDKNHALSLQLFNS